MAEIRIQGVSKVFPGEIPVEALADIDLAIGDGEFVSVLGPSGCGKSTLLEIVAGLQPPTSGRVFIGGTPVSGPSRRLGVVFQDPSLFPWRTVEQNIGFGLELRGVGKEERRERVQAYVDLVKLRGFEQKYPHQLSGGMRQRAGLARTLVNSPDVLLMDEPFGAVDHLTRLGLQDDLLDICAKEAKTVIFVTHDVPEAVFLGGRVLLLTPRPGRICKVFAVTSPQPRKRNNPLLAEIHEEIYRLLYETGEVIEEEYAI